MFCRIVAGTAPASVVHRDDRVLAFMDIQPVNAGQVLVVPIRHASGLADLDAADARQMFATAQRIAAALRRSGVRCEGVNLFLADGAVAMQEVFHPHLHVIPRFAGDGFGFAYGDRNFVRLDREPLERAAADIRAAMTSS